MKKVPTGFVRQDSVELDPNGLFGPQSLQSLEQLPCVLYTDRSGTNYFELDVEGTKYYLPLRTD